jgi:hypothetical protein
MASAGRKRENDTPTTGSGGVNVWDLLTDAVQGHEPRPENSVTPDELAAKMGTSHSYACGVLRRNPALRAVQYHRENGKRAVCYVPKGEN